MKVSIVKGNNRKHNIRKALELLKDDINTAIKKKNSDTLFIKVNTIDPNFPLACTHPDALGVVLEYFVHRFNHVIVGDNSFAFSKNQGNIYSPLAKKFEIEFSDLSEFGSKEIGFKQINGTYKTARISSLPSKAFTISLALPKTHDVVVYTGCSKNMIGCLVENRGFIHGLKFYHRLFLDKAVKGFKTTNENIVEVLVNAKPDLSVLDGFVGMEGNGPIQGKKVKLRIAMCSEDCIALDSLIAGIIGFDFVSYLSLCEKKSIGTTDAKKIHILKDGFEDLRKISKKFKPHYLYKYQISANNLNTGMIGIDFKLLMSFIRRYYRIKDKVLEKIQHFN